MAQETQQMQSQPAVVEKNDRYEIRKLLPEDWSVFSEDAHRACFAEFRPAYTDRIDYALLACNPNKYDVLAYVTVRELDNESAYWQYGGAFPSIAKGTQVYRIYNDFVECMRRKYKRVTTLVENTNVSYLKLAMKCGFRIVGVRMFKGCVLVELLNEFGEVRDALPI